MFDGIFEAIEEWMRELLTGMVTSNLTTMFTDVNEKTGEIAAQVGQTPQGWNGSIFSLIQNLSNSVIVPIAGVIITFVLCYELITMLTEKNNMLEGRAEGVSERGSFYELTDAVLTAGYPLGVSNEYADGSDCITISTRKGALVVVETVPDGPILS